MKDPNKAYFFKIDDVLAKTGPIEVDGLNVDAVARYVMRTDAGNSAPFIDFADVIEVTVISASGIRIQVPVRSRFHDLVVKELDRIALERAQSLPAHKWEEVEFAE